MKKEKIIEIMIMLITAVGTFFILLIFINWFGTKIGLFEQPIYKPDGNLYLHIDNDTQTIYLGHDRIINFCRGEFVDGYEEYQNLTCQEKFEGCGAVNCECWVN
jgi:hypothetical protein